MERFRRIRRFADRLAAILDSHHPRGRDYANLAIRGRRIRDVLNDQLPRALAMRPDLITVCVGMNDITRPDCFSTGRGRSRPTARATRGSVPRW